MANPSSKDISDRFEQAQDRLVLQASDLSLRTIADMVESGSIDLQPEYQRRDRWSPEKMSALIESFLLNIPIPPVYLSEETYGTYAIIDGKQRISSVSEFMSDRLKLRSLETFHEIQGMTFNELPKELQNALTVRPYIRAVTLLKQSDPLLKYEVFSRLNTGGVALNAQEIRNVAYRGPLNDAIVSTAKSDVPLRSQLKIKNDNSSAYREMTDVEYVLRFLTLSESWKTFSGDLKASMNEFMRINRDTNGSDLDRLIASYSRASNACAMIWGKYAFQRYSASGWRDQLLAGMYDAEMIGVHQLSDGQIDELMNRPHDVLTITQNLFQDPSFDTSVRSGTNTPSRLRYRVDSMHDALTSMRST